VNYYRHYLGDYQRDTARLSLLEHGAYRLLLDAYYGEDGPLPADEAELFLMCKAMTAADRAAVRKVAARYFVRDGDKLTNPRADREIALGLKAIDIARNNGKRGGRPVSHKEPSGIPAGIPSGVPSGKAPHPPTANLHYPITTNYKCNYLPKHRAKSARPFRRFVKRG